MSLPGSYTDDFLLAVCRDGHNGIIANNIEHWYMELTDKMIENGDTHGMEVELLNKKKEPRCDVVNGKMSELDIVDPCKIVMAIANGRMSTQLPAPTSGGKKLPTFHAPAAE
jgi:hypothetical protein